MNKQYHTNKDTEVYSISGFKDTLASPVFYPVIVVALILGLVSIFGFVQNPLKLKSMVTVIKQKVAENNVVNDSFETNLDYLVSDNIKNSVINIQSNNTQTNRVSTSHSNTDVNSSEKMQIGSSFERIAFNYDLTSESFWRDLDSSNIETVAEELERKQRESSTFGAPLRIDSIENLPTDLNVQDDSIYALNHDKKT